MSQLARLKQAWKWWISPEPTFVKFSREWWVDMIIKFTVFGITGSSAMFFARPLLGTLFGLHGEQEHEYECVH